MATRRLPSPELLRQLLRYEPETGKLYWRPRAVELFSSGKQPATQNQAIWNAKFAGKLALDSIDGRGTRGGSLFYRRVKAHRVIWALVHGEWPGQDIDHINGDATDNRLVNLRHVSHKENGRNQKLGSNNTSGYCGVFQRPSGRWAAQITIDGRNRIIGTFDCVEDAAAARSTANAEHGFHPNHGTSR